MESNQNTKKNLPVKLFQKREDVDDRRTEGSGGELPSWAKIPMEALSQKAEMIQHAMNSTVEELENRREGREFIPTVIKVELNNLATAKSYRGDVANIFNSNNEYNLIAVTDTTEILVKINSVNEAVKITSKLNRPDKFLIGVAAIQEITRFEPTVQLEKDQIQKNKPLRVKLINYKNTELNVAIEKTFESICEGSNMKYKKIKYAPGLTVYRLSNVSADSLKDVEEFEALESVTMMPTYDVSSDDLESDSIDIAIKLPQEGIDYPLVGILDSGIAEIPHLKPWLIKDKFNKIPDQYADLKHGTFVSGVLLYGDELEGEAYTGFEGCYLYDARVFTSVNNEVEEGDLIEHIRDAIEGRPDIKIWNLSLGTKEAADENRFSYFGITLDSLQQEYNVLICKSAGNCRNFLKNKPISRISRSADTVNSLVVGSVASSKGEHEISEPYHRSPFSRIGKGPNFINKPDVTHVGGNAGVNPATSKLVFEGVKSFAIDGKIARQSGTSFSTPRITALAAGLCHRINEDFDPTLLKALIIHNSKYPEVITLPIDERIKQMGFGIPPTIDDMIFNDQSEITLIMQDTLEKGKWIEIFDFPFPEDLIKDGFYEAEITVTLVAAPLLDFDQGTEYCQSNLTVMLGTYDKIKRRVYQNGRRTGRSLPNPLGLDGNQNILSDSLYATPFRLRNTGPFARERVLLKYGDKYHPVKKYAVNLEEMTRSNKENYLKAPKRWYLKIESFYRDFIAQDAVTRNQSLSQDFTLIITIRDKSKKHKVYDNVNKLLNDNNFIHSNINLRGDNQIRFGSN